MHLSSAAAIFASLPAVEEVTMEATVTLECSSTTQEMMVMVNVLVKLVETVVPLERVAEMSALESVAEMPALLSDHPISG